MLIRDRLPIQSIHGEAPTMIQNGDGTASGDGQVPGILLDAESGRQRTRFGRNSRQGRYSGPDRPLHFLQSSAIAGPSSVCNMGPEITAPKVAKLAPQPVLTDILTCAVD